MDHTVKLDTFKNGDKIAENVNLISKLNDDFFTDKTEKGKHFKVINLHFINNLIPKIKVGKGYYYGPSDAITNTEFGEYVAALNAYSDFSNSSDLEDLNNLVSVLYRPGHKDKTNLNDRRIPFDKAKTAYYSKQIENIDFKYKYAIYLFFAACQNFIVTNQELEVSGGVDVDLSLLFKQGKSKEKGIGMVGVIYSLAETKVFGNADETAQQNTYDVLLRMMQTYYQAKKLERDAKNR
jgi:hypothetical protein